MVKILIAGDFCPQNETEEMLDKKEYVEVFSDFLPLLAKCDYNVINLECPVLIGDGVALTKSGVLLKCKPTAVEALKKVGFNLVTLANNHFYDWGNQGVKDTIHTCKSLDLDFVGSGQNIQEAQQILYKRINKKTFAFLNFCENEFSIASNKRGGSNPLNPIANYYQIQEAQSNANYVIVIVHGGHEHYQLPSPRMKETYRFFVDAGANAVVSHHTHCYSGNEIYRGAPIIYGLGNFIFNSSFKENNTFNEGYAVVLTFKNNEVFLKEYPLVQCRDNAGVRFMTEEELIHFQKNMKVLNNIISKSNMLKTEFEKMSKDMASSYLTYFEPYSRRITKALYNRHLLPSFLNKKKIINLLGIIRCEAHRDIVLTILRNKIE